MSGVVAPDLSVNEDAITDAGLRGLIDEWFVPTIVERIVRGLTRDQKDE